MMFDSEEIMPVVSIVIKLQYAWLKAYKLYDYTIINYTIVLLLKAKDL